MNSEDTLSPKLQSIAPSLEEVLDNRAPTPYSHADFEAFLKPTKLHHLLQLWDALQHYDQTWINYCTHRSNPSRMWGGLQFDIPIILPTDVRDVVSRIHFMYLAPGSPRNVGIPPHLFHNLVHALASNRICDPILLKGVRDQTFTRLLYLYPHFIRNANSFNLTFTSSLLNGMAGIVLLSLSLIATYVIIFISDSIRIPSNRKCINQSLANLRKGFTLPLVGFPASNIRERYPFRLFRVEARAALDSHRCRAIQIFILATVSTACGALALYAIPNQSQ
ncbi:hypothetical protein L0F63_005222 [Massospora cicadina]|nr:hypothetical protein L0F63_005222 [Massospora cicadina]